MTRVIDRRQFLKRSGMGFAALSSSPLVVLSTACRRQENIKKAEEIGAAVIRKWASSLQGQVILPGDEMYESARLVWNRAIDRHPALIVRCADVPGVVRAIEFARTYDLIVAVRGGGHSQAGHSVCDSGLVIDLGKMRSIRVDSQSSVVHAGAGVRVGALDRVTQEYGLATPSGGCPTVGIAGLTLGGGETALMAKYGTACDNVLSAEVVTADGRVLTASSQENPDLYWAIRGGSGNFGIVTSFKLRLYPVTQVLAGALTFPVARARDVLPFYRDFMKTAPDELQTFAGLMPVKEGSVLAIAIVYCGDAKAGEKVVEALRSKLRPQQDDVKMISYLESQNFFIPPSASFGTGGFLPEMSDEVVNVLAAHFQEAPPSSTAMWNDYHGAVTRVAVGDMAFPLRQPGYDLFISAAWSTPAEKSAAVNWVTRFREAMRPFSRGVYVNTMGEESEERVREAYGTNYKRLATLKAKYDPTNFFHLNQNIKPAI